MSSWVVDMNPNMSKQFLLESRWSNKVLPNLSLVYKVVHAVLFDNKVTLTEELIMDDRKIKYIAMTEWNACFKITWQGHPDITYKVETGITSNPTNKQTCKDKT